MPSPIAHCGVGLVLWPAMRGWGGGAAGELTRMRRWFLAGALLFALLAPDLDILIDPLLGRAAFASHGGPSHSLFAGVIFAIAFAAVCRIAAPIPWMRLWLVGCLAYWSHIGLDVLTHGRGVMALWPLSSERISSPLPIFFGVKHSRWQEPHLHALTIANELPLLLVLWLARRRLRRRGRGGRAQGAQEGRGGLDRPAAAGIVRVEKGS